MTAQLGFYSPSVLFLCQETGLSLEVAGCSTRRPEALVLHERHSFKDDRELTRARCRSS